MRSDLASKVIMDCRTDESRKLKRNLEFRLHEMINTKEQALLKSIKKALDKELDCVFIRINTDEENFNILKEINKIHRKIKKTTKKSLINDLSKRLLELEFQSNHSIKSKCLKWTVKTILPDYKK